MPNMRSPLQALSITTGDIFAEGTIILVPFRELAKRFITEPA